ncbi:ABC transporter permease [Thalassobaculum litoreum]|uniref:ABC-2 type transport system permease protein n=1 Tax=Thalassobaculum litoreum DSM 18839 TaxID=1123362 RepID=A0A8G2BIY1_9PROT|nr:ABC transporter permease [Thalassobaculum litoreum]SDF87376.1 ABC-2 type transport system permease protein [Thalassobaculum litoreum DSM 18839]
MTRLLRNTVRLGVKELYSLSRDLVLVGLIAYTFTVAIYTVARGQQTELSNAVVSVVDEDRSVLSQRIRGALLPPHFRPAELIGLDALDRVLDSGRASFALDIPPGLQADVLAGRAPTIQLNVDATAMTLAGNGTRYISSIIQAEVADFLGRAEDQVAAPTTLTVRARFNPNLESSWFTSVMQVINNLTTLAVILSGAAVIREREHGTLEHLLAMPVRPAEIVLAKIWANGLVILLAAILSLTLVVQIGLGVPVAGSLWLFALGAGIYLFAITSLGVMLSTIATTMPQFGLLAIPVFVVLNLLSGATTPLESMPEPLRTVMLASPATHFVAFAQAVLYRDAGIGIVWPEMLTVGGLGGAFFVCALIRFRATIAAAR